MAYFAFSILQILDIYSDATLITYVVVTCFSIMNLIYFGDANFNRLKMVGPYQVGHKEYFTSGGGNGVSVYYPMDKEEYRRLIK